MINEFRPMNHLTRLQNLICTIGNLPTSYVLSMSYEEQVWWLCEFLENKVFPAIEENTNITEETQQAFVELQQYVTDYFNNLDVQDEINNKLDEMVENGTLLSILNFVEINVKSYGAVGDGLTDDYASIQRAINENPLKTIYFPQGTYAISQKLVIKNANSKSVNLKLDKNAIIKNYNNTQINTLLEIGKDTTDGQYTRYTGAYKVINIEGGIFDCENVVKGIICNSDRQFVYIKNTNFINISNYGLYLEKGDSYTSGDSKIIECSFFSQDSLYGTAIYASSNDNELLNIRIDGCKIGVDIEGASIILHDIHCTALYSERMSSNDKMSTVAFLINGSNAEFNQCYADTYATGFKITKGTGVSIVNCTCYYYNAFNQNERTQAVWIDTTEDIELRIINSHFSSPENSQVPHQFFRFRGLYQYTLALNSNYINLINNRYINHNNVSYKDIAYCLQVNNKKGIVPYYNGRTFEVDNWYYLGSFIITGQFPSNKFRIKNKKEFECEIEIIDNETIKIINSNNKFWRTWTFGFTESETLSFDDENTLKTYDLYVKIGNERLLNSVHTSIEPLTFNSPFFSYRKLIPTPAENLSIIDDVTIYEDRTKFLNEETIIIGDSYAQGYSPDSDVNLESWAVKLQRRFNNAVIKYKGGVGFHASVDDKNFLSLLQEAENSISNKKHIKNIIVAGGYNDANSSSSSVVSQKGYEFIEYVKNNFPYATIYVAMIGYSTDNDKKSQLINISLPAYQYMSAFDNCVYLNNSEYSLTDNLMTSDGYHPNENGQTFIYKNILQALKTGSGFIQANRATL